MEIKLETLGKTFFRCSFPRMKYENNIKTDEQERNDEGISLWSVKVEAIQNKNNVEEFFIVIPCEKNPAEALQLNEEVVFSGLRLISGPRKTGGRWEKFEAEKIMRKKRGE